MHEPFIALTNTFTPDLARRTANKGVNQGFFSVRYVDPSDIDLLKWCFVYKIQVLKVPVVRYVFSQTTLLLTVADEPQLESFLPKVFLNNIFDCCHLYFLYFPSSFYLSIFSLQFV